MSVYWVLALYLLLQISTASSKIGYYHDVYVPFYKTRTLVKPTALLDNVTVEHMIILRDLVNDHDFAAATPLKNSSSLSVEIIGEGVNNITRKCQVPFEPLNYNARVLIKQMRRLSDKSVLILVNESSNSEVKHLKLVLLNTNNCKYEYIYDGNVPFEGHYIFTSDNTNDDRFVLVMYGKDYCHGYNWCRLFFNPLHQKFESITDFNFPWNRLTYIEPKSTFDDDILIVRRVIKDVKTFRMDLYNLANDNQSVINKQKQFFIRKPITHHEMGIKYYFGFANSRTWYNMKFSGLSLCQAPEWIEYDPDSRVIQCTRFHDNGDLMFNETIVYEYKRLCLYVHTIDNGLILSTQEYSCATINCRKVEFVLMVAGNKNNLTHDSKPVVQVKRKQYDVECIADALRIERLKSDDHSFRVRYLCVRNDHFVSYHVLDISF